MAGGLERPQFTDMTLSPWRQRISLCLACHCLGELFHLCTVYGFYLLLSRERAASNMIFISLVSI